MSNPASGEHQHEAHLMAFMEKSTSAYITETAKWLRKKYPVSFERLKERLRAVRDRKQEEERRKAR